MSSRPKIKVLMAKLFEAMRSARCICRKGKTPPEPFCTKCERRLSRDAMAGIRSVVAENKAAGYYDAVKELEAACVLRDGALEGTFGR